MHTNTAPDLVGHRRDSTTRRAGAGAGAGPLYSFEPLPSNRERRAPAQPPKKRRRPTPPTPALSYNPQDRRIPNGIHDPFASPPTSSKPATSEALTNPHEQQTVSIADREIPAPFHDEYDAQIWPHILDHPTGYSISACRDTSFPENDMSPVAPDSYDSPASYTSSSSPAPSDQSPRTAEFTIQGIDYVPSVQHSIPVCPYDTQAYIAAVHQDSYGFSMDHYQDQSLQGYPVQYVEPVRDRSGLHGSPPCSGNNGYQYPNSRRS